jgi:hypothetical protein
MMEVKRRSSSGGGQQPWLIMWREFRCWKMTLTMIYADRSSLITHAPKRSVLLVAVRCVCVSLCVSVWAVLRYGEMNPRSAVTWSAIAGIACTDIR